MCVIIHSMRKKYLKRLDVIQAMNKNPSGFFMCHWPNGSKSKDDRKSLRTMSEGDAIKFFEGVPDDDEFVMHARIPSKGGTTLDNVHGWEEDGIMFCHNMTMSSLSHLMELEKWNGTDSEYFFRKLFIPMHRGEHLDHPDLKPGELGIATKRLVALLCGETNKFLFIMPDNTVVRAGKWDTLESEKRVMMEEREVDEVIGESVGIDGKVVKKTQKIKKEIAVEREFATVLASNTYFRTTYDTKSYTQGSLYGWARGAGCCGTSSSASARTSAASSGYADYDYYGLDYDEDEDAVKFAKHCEKKSEVKDASKVKGKIKKSDISDSDIRKFMEWRKSLPGYTNRVAITQKDLDESIVFNKEKFENGKFTPESMINVFNMMLRSIVYASYKDNIPLILESDAFVGTEDELGIYTTESECLMANIVPETFDDTLKTYMQDLLLQLHEDLKINVADDHPFMLPSEAFTETLASVVSEIDSTYLALTANSSSNSTFISEIVDVNEADEFAGKLRAVDNLLNLSFDPTVKANKDIEKYVKAALVIDRKLRWIPPALLLSSGDTMVSSRGSWVESKTKSDYIEALNFLAEACVTSGDSLESADRKYIADLKNLGFDFDKKGSKEIFTPGAAVTVSPTVATAQEAAAGSNDAESEQTASEAPAATAEHEPTVLGDPEKGSETGGTK